MDLPEQTMAGRLRCCVTLLLKRDFHRAGVLPNFWEPHRKGKYAQKIKISSMEALRYGIKEIPKELKKLKEEIVSDIKCDQLYGVEHNDYEVLWRFDSPESLDPWIVTCDSDFNEGKSTAEFILNKNKKGLFCGNLNTEVPKDGILKSSGYCNITSPLNEVCHNNSNDINNNIISFYKRQFCNNVKKIFLLQISFKRNISYDFSNFTHMLIRARGDGRAYHMTVNMTREWDVQWNDQYQYILFTRGGPYWQVSKVTQTNNKS